MRSSTLICFIATFVSQVHGQPGTTALWLFDEPVGCYPSTTLTDNGPHDITVVLGRGAVMAPGRFGNALAVRPAQPLRIGATTRYSSAFGRRPRRRAGPSRR